MRYGLSILAFLLIASFTAGQEPPAMGKAVKFEQAGVELALPSGFSQQQLTGASEIMVATRTESGQATQSVSLLLYVADPEQTPEDIAKSLLEPIKNDLALRHVKVEKSIAITVAGLKGHANYLSYIHRGEPTEAIQLCFLRKVKPTGQKPFRLAYVMTMEVNAQHKNKLMQTLDGVLKSIRLLDMKHPLQCKIQFRGEYYKDFKRRFAVRIPMGFYILPIPMGINVAQNDFLAGGWPNPNIMIASMLVPGELSAKQCGERAIAFEKKKAGLKVEVLSQRPIKLDKKDGYEFVLKKTLVSPASAPASQPAKTQPAPPKQLLSAIQIQRLVCIPSAEELNKQRHIAIIMTCRGVSPEKAREFMDEFCKSFGLLKAPVTAEKEAK